MKKVLLSLMVVVVLSISSVALGGYGISQRDYDTVVAERNAAEAEVMSLRSEMYSTETQIKSLRAAPFVAQAKLMEQKFQAGACT